MDVLSSSKTTGLARELIDPLIVGAIRALARAKRFAEIPAYLLRSEVSCSPVMVAAANAYVALKQGQNSEAGQFLNDALALRQPADTRAVTDFLARTLMEAGRLSDALPLLQELFNAQTPNFLLNCASRLKQVKVILDTCQALYERGERDWDVTEFESQYLAEYDFPKALCRLQEVITANPNHRLAQLRLAIAALRYGRNDLASISEQTLPTVEKKPQAPFSDDFKKQQEPLVNEREGMLKNPPADPQRMMELVRQLRAADAAQEARIEKQKEARQEAAIRLSYLQGDDAVRAKVRWILADKEDGSDDTGLVMLNGLAHSRNLQLQMKLLQAAWVDTQRVPTGVLQSALQQTKASFRARPSSCTTATDYREERCRARKWLRSTTANLENCCYLSAANRLESRANGVLPIDERPRT